MPNERIANEVTSLDFRSLSRLPRRSCEANWILNLRKERSYDRNIANKYHFNGQTEYKDNFEYHRRSIRYRARWSIVVETQRKGVLSKKFTIQILDR